MDGMPAALKGAPPLDEVAKAWTVEMRSYSLLPQLDVERQVEEGSGPLDVGHRQVAAERLENAPHDGMGV
jgi:hypothetical protein